MKEAEPLLRVLADVWFVTGDAAAADVFDILFTDGSILGQVYGVEIYVEPAIFHVIDARQHRCAGAKVKDSATLGASKGSVKEHDVCTPSAVTLVQADDEQSVVCQCLLKGVHSLFAGEVIEAGPVSASLADKKSVGKRIGLLLIYKAGWQIEAIEPGEVGLEPATMVSGENSPLSPGKSCIKMLFAADDSVFNEIHHLLAVKDKDQPKGPGELQISAFENTHPVPVGHVRKHPAQVVVGNRKPEREEKPD